MAQIRLSIFLLLLVILFSIAAAKHPAIRRRSRARAFVESQCKRTRYPKLCVRSLSNYVSNFTTELSHKKLAQIALSVNLASAKATREYVTGVVKQLNRTKVKDLRLVSDCLEQINDGVVQLTNCMNETEKLNEYAEDEFRWHASNVQTWMSTTATDARICIEMFSDRAVRSKTKTLIKARVLNLEQLTCNALALFDGFATRRRASFGTKPKV